MVGSCHQFQLFECLSKLAEDNALAYFVLSVSEGELFLIALTPSVNVKTLFFVANGGHNKLERFLLTFLQ